jgi:hypothetical protein
MVVFFSVKQKLLLVLLILPITGPLLWHYSVLLLQDAIFLLLLTKCVNICTSLKSITAVKRILRYLQGTLHHGLHLQPSSKLHVLGICDSDWGADKDDNKSTTSYCVYFGTNLVYWSSKKQQAVSRSSTEAEYHGIAVVTADILWLKSLLKELRVSIPTPKVYCDNLGAVLLAANPNHALSDEAF